MKNDKPFQIETAVIVLVASYAFIAACVATFGLIDLLTGSSRLILLWQ